MKNRLIKTFIMILTIFIMFFIGNNKVKADDTCYWVSPLTYFDEQGKPMYISSTFEYETEGRGKFGPDAKAITNVNSFILKRGKNWNLGYSVDSSFINTASGSPLGLKLNNQGDFSLYMIPAGYEYYFNSNFDVKNCSSQKYIKVEAYMTGTSHRFDITESTEQEYIAYLKKGNKKGNLTACSTDEHTKEIYDESCSDGESDTFWNYMYNNGAMYFINTNAKQEYPKEKYSELVNELIKNNNWKKEKLTARLAALNIDTADKNIFTYTKAYYDATKNTWAKYYREGENTRISFKVWFKSSGRYILEENPTLFKEYFKYANDNNAQNNPDYNTILEILDGMILLEKNDDKKSCLETNPCAVLCHAGKDAKSFTCSGTAFDQCSAASEDYKKCSAAYKACEGVKNQASAYDACMKVNMGDDLYTKYTDDKQVVSDAVDQEKKDLLNQISAALSRISEPTLNIDFEGYKVKCEDVVIFHDLYIILRIAAPILVIILGSLDYAKATLASDIDKMEKEKKKFPKRLILVVLFMIVPVIIDIILNLFSSSTNMDINSNIMYCIIRGS